MPGVEEYGVEPIPAELRTVRWRDLFAINFTFFLNPVMYVLGALAVVNGGLPLWWAVAAMVLGQALAYAMLVVIAQPGVDYGVPGQVAMRGTLGLWGARTLSSPYRMIAGTYWFAAQALAGALGIQAIVVALGAGKPPLVPVALGLGAFQAILAVVGFDVMRYVLRVVLPISLAFTGVILALYLTSDDPSYAPSHVFHSPEQQFTWLGFATYVTVICGASLTLVPSIADFCRYTPTRRDVRIGLFISAVLAVAVTTFIGGYAGAATGELNPYVAVADLTSVDAAARDPPRRGRRPRPRRQHHERLHRRPLAAELGSVARAAPAPRWSPRGLRSGCARSPGSSSRRRPGSPISATSARRSPASCSPTMWCSSARDSIPGRCSTRWASTGT